MAAPGFAIGIRLAAADGAAVANRRAIAVPGAHMLGHTSHAPPRCGMSPQGGAYWRPYWQPLANGEAATVNPAVGASRRESQQGDLPPPGPVGLNALANGDRATGSDRRARVYGRGALRHTVLLIVCRLRGGTTPTSSIRMARQDTRLARRKRILHLVGHEIRRRREARDFSQEELAEQAGLHRTYVGSVERGERNLSLENLVRIAGALGCRSRDLLPTAIDE